MDQNPQSGDANVAVPVRNRARFWHKWPQAIPVSEETVLAGERKLILEESKQSQAEGGFLGLALSGGGIRSATFNLGVLQGLAERGLLSRLDYLSTVSGGGYIGSWLSALIQRDGDGIAGVEKTLDPRNAADKGGTEAAPVGWLRRFSNYLTPRAGLLSTDSLAGVATYVRNLLLMQSLIVGVFAAVLVLPRQLPWLAGLRIVQSPLLCIVALSVAAIFLNLNLSRALIEGREAPPWFARQSFVLALIVAPLILAAWLASVLLLRSRADGAGELAKLVEAGLTFGAVWVVAWALVEFVIVRSVRTTLREGQRRLLVVFLSLLVAVVVSIEVLCLVREALLAHADSAALPWHWMVWGVPVMLVVFGLGSILLIGLVGREFAEEEREWWSRLGAWLIAGGLGWFVLCAASIYGPFAILRAQAWAEGLSVAWVVSTLGGVLLGKSKATGGHGTSKWLNLATEVAPYVFVAGLLLALSFGIHVGLVEWFGTGNAGRASGELPLLAAPTFVQYAQELNVVLQARPSTWLPVLLPLALILLLIARLDINLFSFHMFYRNRLVRCYLGASNRARNPHPFTGFDPKDNIKLADLPARPFHIVNTAINLTKVNNLAWQERKAASFVLTRAYCGYRLQSTGPNDPGTLGYQPTAQYLDSRGWLSLGQALTISGAAVSPNQGYHSSKAVAFLLTVFNVRLGWWMQNPAQPGAWATPGPFFGLKYLLYEVLGLASEDTKFVYLSDGGHFENLGIYELVRRKCRFIIAIDAGMDPKFGFEDLGNAVRKCQVDFGVRIDIDTKASVPIQGSGKSLYHCGVGRIHYEEADRNAISGFLLYIKPSLTGNEPVDIMQYAAVHPEFPHQSTTDQWFDESQFEAYRKLGHYIVTTVIEKQTDTVKPILLDMFVDLGRRWYRPSARVEAHFTKHAERLMQLQDTLREQQILSFLDDQMFPEWNYLMAGGNHEARNSLWLPTDPEQLRAGFYFCLNLLELMQDVYLDLNLDEEWQHADNRGWMNLFRHLSWCGMLRATFAVVRSNFGARFQRFCAVRIDLREGDIEIAAKFTREGASGQALKAWTDRLVADGQVNFQEARQICLFENSDLAGASAATAKFDTLHRIRLVVPGVRRGEDKPADPDASELVFPVGLALTRGGAIVFFRIQDHLRNMGLGRQALERLFETYKELTIDADSADAKRIEYLFYSIKGSRR
ncbi:MAG: hypothetical protein ABI648_09865 [Betaproteobacteria bacterium]